MRLKKLAASRVRVKKLAACDPDAARPSLFKQLTRSDLRCPLQAEAPFSVLPMRVCCHVGWHTI